MKFNFLNLLEKVEVAFAERKLEGDITAPTVYRAKLRALFHV